MLKSQSTQFALTFFFGPLGLAYISMAAAVLMTLTMVVLYFTLLGPVAVVLMWLLAMLLGATLIKLHNNQLRHTGANLLTQSSYLSDFSVRLLGWARGFAVLVLIVGAGLALYKFAPKMAGKVIQMAESGDSKSWSAGLSDAGSALLDKLSAATAADPGDEAAKGHRVEVFSSAQGNDSNLSSTVFSESNVDSAIVVGASTANGALVSRYVPAESIANSNDGSVVAKGYVTVKESVVNLRSGPGMQYPVVTTAKRGEQLMEFVSEGSWTNVQSSKSGRILWVFTALIER